MNMQSILDWDFLGASLGSWLLAIVAASLFGAAWGWLRGKLAERDEEQTGKAIAALKRRAAERRQLTRDIKRVIMDSTLRISVFALVVAAGIELQDFPADVTFWSRKILFVILMLQAGTWGDALLKYVFDRPENLRLVGGVKFLIRAFMWLFVALITLENLGVDISAAITGLGITGVAVALATQRIIGDILAFLSITYDEPFEVGDFLVVDEDSGTVEEVTLRSTRLRTLSGEALVISNSALLSTRIRNYETLGERRVVVTIGVVRDTPHATLAEIPAIVSDVVRQVENAKLDRVHLRDITPSAFDYEIVYFILTPDYNTYMDIRQQINLEIVRRFEEHGIRLALPIHQVRVLDDSSEKKGQ